MATVPRVVDSVGSVRWKGSTPASSIDMVILFLFVAANAADLSRRIMTEMFGSCHLKERLSDVTTLLHWCARS
jgi:hypothetical protein